MYLLDIHVRVSYSIFLATFTVHNGPREAPELAQITSWITITTDNIKNCSLTEFQVLKYHPC